MNDDEAKFAIDEWTDYLGATETTDALYDEKNFEQRAEVIDFISFGLIEGITALPPKATQAARIIKLQERAERLIRKLNKIDSALFKKLRANIRSGACTGAALKALLGDYLDTNPAGNPTPYEYDNLDVFINRLLCSGPMPRRFKKLEPGMVYYQKTPARVMLQMAEEIEAENSGVFVDIGAGMGQVVMLVNLLTGITARGIEIDPALCRYAARCAGTLGLTGATFTHADARQALYPGANVFFMFTPFTGKMLQQVLQRLQREAQHKKIKLITYGPCTEQVALQNWLQPVTPGVQGHGTGIFIAGQ